MSVLVSSHGRIIELCYHPRIRIQWNSPSLFGRGTLGKKWTFRSILPTPVELLGFHSMNGAESKSILSHHYEINKYYTYILSWPFIFFSVFNLCSH